MRPVWTVRQVVPSPNWSAIASPSSFGYRQGRRARGRHLIGITRKMRVERLFASLD
jgi:hypothetical protein